MRGCGCALGSTAIATRSTSEHGGGVPPEELRIKKLSKDLEGQFQLKDLDAE